MLEKDIRVDNQPIFLLGAHKSGTSLLRSLFDGHPDLFVLPVEAHLFEKAGFWVDYSFRRSHPVETERNKLITTFVDMIKEYNQTSNPQADSITSGMWNVPTFQAALEQADLSTTASTFEAVFQAMHLSLYGIPLEKGKRIVEKSVEHAEFALDLHQLYPKAKFIHIVRNPYASMVSFRRFKTEGKYPFLKGILHSLYNSYYFLVKNQQLLPDYLVVRYEDLVQKPDYVIKNIIRFTGITDHPALYQPTVGGKIWRGNSVSGEQFSGISTRSLQRWQDEINPYEIDLLNKVIPAYIWKKFGYELLATTGNRFAPISDEHLKTYVANRLLWYFV